MRKIIGEYVIGGNQYFRNAMKECGYTAGTLTSTYNSLHPEKPISVSAVHSWSSGRRSFASTSAQTVMRLAHILSGDPDCSETDHERYMDIAYHLVNGCRTPIYAPGYDNIS